MSMLCKISRPSVSDSFHSSGSNDTYIREPGSLVIVGIEGIGLKFKAGGLEKFQSKTRIAAEKGRMSILAS